MLSLLLQCTAQFAVVAMFQLRKEYIAKNLCENRDRPQMKCCGKCYLKKQLKKVDANNEAGSESAVKMEKEMLVYIVPYRILHDVSTVFYQVVQHNTWHNEMMAHVFVDDIFHPPSSGC